MLLLIINFFPSQEKKKLVVKLHGGFCNVYIYKFVFYFYKYRKVLSNCLVGWSFGLLVLRKMWEKTHIFTLSSSTFEIYFLFLFKMSKMTRTNYKSCCYFYWYIMDLPNHFSNSWRGTMFAFSNCGLLSFCTFD